MPTKIEVPLRLTLAAQEASRDSFSWRFDMKTSRSRSSSRSTGRRSTIKPKGDARFIRRDSRGRITESDDAGRSLKTDRRQKAKRKVRSGYGDRGDR